MKREQEQSIQMYSTSRLMLEIVQEIGTLLSVNQDTAKALEEVKQSSHDNVGLRLVYDMRLIKDNLLHNHNKIGEQCDKIFWNCDKTNNTADRLNRMAAELQERFNKIMAENNTLKGKLMEQKRA